MDAAQLANARRIFTCRAGSHVYGLQTAASDQDTRGVFVGLPDNAIGLYPIEHCEFNGDYMVYELRKFINLAKDCNPNIIELLYIDETDILLSEPVWEKLRSKRDLFLTKRAKHTFSGYATAQLKKIRGHNKWLHNPQPVERPEPAKYLKSKFIEGLGEREVFDQRAYDDAHRGWQQYWEWKQNRNPTRAVTEAQHGFDTKHAMHLIRLLKMGHEILSGQGVQVRRPDRDELLAIRGGEWSFERVTKYADELMAQMDELYEAAPLPRAPDLGAINDLMLEIYRDYWRERGEF